jgi:glycerol-3-phosphate dehydrogenase (NAD(P)+)
MTTRIAILGSGAMATACSLILNENENQEVSIWGRNSEHVDAICQDRENRRLLPGITIPNEIQITSDIQEATVNADILIASIPTKFLREALSKISSAITSPTPVISVIKGLENKTFMRPSEIIKDVLGDRTVLALGGPSHAEEIARRKPASVVAACEDLEFANQVQSLFNTDRFRVYTNKDIIGVELAGALKNVVAIAAGICDGLEFGDNAKSALITRGLVEMTRFGMEMGAEQITFSGLAGMGDLVTTCFSKHSRNRSVGEKLGKGKSLTEILDETESVAEGVTATKSIYELSQEKKLEMPIVSEVYRVLFEKQSPLEATARLMMRPPRDE